MWPFRRNTAEKVFDEFAQYALAIFYKEFESEPHQLAMHTAWVRAGIYFANQAVENVGILKAAWGKGDLNKAAALSLIFTTPLISWFYYKIMGDNTKFSQADRKAASKAGRDNVASLFGFNEGNYNPEPSDMLDEQFWYELEDTDDPDHPSMHGGVPRTRWLLQLDLALVGARQDNSVDWMSCTFPIRQDSDLVWKGTRLDTGDLMMLAQLETAAIKGMTAIFGELRPNPEQPPTAATPYY